MKNSISSNLAAEVFRRIAAGQSTNLIATKLGISHESITDLLKRIQPSLLPSRSGRMKPEHCLTQEDKRKGGAASQRVRRAQRDNLFVRINKLVNIKEKAAYVAVITYFLQPGSPKEFLITISSEDIGLIYLKTFQGMGAPEKSIRFQWRQQPKTAEEECLIRSSWGKLGALIEFSNTGNARTLRLRVSSFIAKDKTGEFKVSSRGLAQSFLSVGTEAINAAAK